MRKQLIYIPERVDREKEPTSPNIIMWLQHPYREDNLEAVLKMKLYETCIYESSHLGTEKYTNRFAGVCNAKDKTRSKTDRISG